MVSDPTHTTVVDEQFVRSKLESFGIGSNFSVGNLFTYVTCVKN